MSKAVCCEWDVGKPTSEVIKLTSIAAFRLEQAQFSEFGCDSDPVLLEYGGRGEVCEIHCAYERAQQRFLPLLKQKSNRPQILLAPTAFNVDHILNAEGLKLLIAESVNQLGSKQAFIELIKNINRDSLPQTIPELTARMLDHIWSKGADKIRFPVSDILRTEVEKLFLHNNVDTQPRVGGISTYVGLLDAVFSGTPIVTCLAAPPRGGNEILERIPQSAKINALTVDGVKPLSSLFSENMQAPHFCFSVDEEIIFPPDWINQKIEVQGEVEEAGKALSAEILVTGATSPPGFEGITNEALDSLAANIDGLMLSGLHRLKSKHEVHEVFRELAHFREKPVVLAFSSIREKALIPYILKNIAISQRIDTVSMNTSEAFELLKLAPNWSSEFAQLDSAFNQRVANACELAKADEQNGREQAKWLLEAALSLNQVIEVPVRVRGREIDVTVLPAHLSLSDQELDDYQDITMTSRVIAAQKCALTSGMVGHSADVGELHVIPGVETIQQQKNAKRFLRECYGECFHDPAYAGRYWYRLPDGRTVLAIPTPLIGDKRGGTVSAGDVMDYVKFTLALSQFKERLVHPGNKAT